MVHRTLLRASPASQQSGVVLFIALIVLVAMSLAGVALVRSTDTSVLVAGNLAFRQGTVLASDGPINTARNWVMSNATGDTLYNDSAANGFIANWQDGFNPKTYTWTHGSGSVKVGTDAGGNEGWYVIHRMCSGAGNPTGLSCVKAGTAGKAASSFGAQNYGSYPLQLAGQTPTYRITARVVGPKNTTSYVQVVITP
jgi:Tfp pilus assembly protein PilX